MGPERVVVVPSIVLWKMGAIVCTLAHRRDHTMEVRLIIEDVEVDCAVFDEVDRASAYAIKRMHAYCAPIQHQVDLLVAERRHRHR